MDEEIADHLAVFRESLAIPVIVKEISGPLVRERP